MTRPLVVSLVLAAVLSPQAAPAAAGKDKAPRVTARVAVDPSPARPGEPVRISVRLEPPEGVTLNRYPGITLKIDHVEGLDVASREVFVGTRKPVTDVEKFAFEKVPPLVVEGVAGAGSRRGLIRGELKYFYCVKKSGFCAPASRPLEITVPIGG
ncbi:MAG: hypothetical protein Kow0062_18180 [Acidobacteriota bacterium]